MGKSVAAAELDEAVLDAALHDAGAIKMSAREFLREDGAATKRLGVDARSQRWDEPIVCVCGAA